MILKIRTKRPIQLGFKVTHATPGDDRLTDRLNGPHVLTIDAEWANLPLEFDDVGYDVASFLSAQYSWMESGKRIGLIVWHPDYPFPSNPHIPELSELIVIQADPLHTNPFTLGMCGPKSDIQVLMFYAPHDVRAMVGTELWTDWLLQGVRDAGQSGQETETQWAFRTRYLRDSHA